MLTKLNRRGFTLVEIMIVVAIIGLLAAIAIPNLLRARMNASDGAMKTGMRLMSSANESYRAAQATPTYAPDLDALIDAVPPYLDSTWDSGTKHGFDITGYAVADAPAATYSFLAVAAGGLPTDYCVDQSGVVTAIAAGGADGDETGCLAGVPISG